MCPYLQGKLVEWELLVNLLLENYAHKVSTRWGSQLNGNVRATLSVPPAPRLLVSPLAGEIS
jgi:hypothetical protein